MTPENQWEILATITLKPEHRSTGKARHYSGGILVTTINALQVIHYKGGAGYSLIYLDAAGNEITDTYHDTVEGAYGQAAFEYSVKPEDWERPGSD